MQRDYWGYFIAVLSVIIGVYVSWYFYDKSAQYRKPVFLADFFPSAIYDVQKDFPAPLKVTREDGKPLTKSVYVATNLFWNAGNLPIMSGDILVPIKVTLTAPDIEVLSVSAVKQSRSVVNCSVKQDSANSFQISYRVLEESDGCEIRVIYSGPGAPKYVVSGEILGVKKIEARTETFFDIAEKSKDQSDWIGTFVRIASKMSLLVGLAIFASLYAFSNPTSRRRQWSTNAGLFLIGALTIGAEFLSSRYGVIDSPNPVNTSSWSSLKDTKPL